MSDTLTADQVQQMIDQGVQIKLAERDAQAAEEDRQRELDDLKAKAERADELQTRLDEIEAKSAPDRQPHKRLPGATEDPTPDLNQDPEPRIIVGSKFDNLTIPEMAYGLTLMQNLARVQNRPDFKPSEQYAKALTHKITVKGLGVEKPAKAGGGYYKADELSHSTLTSYGDEWVPDVWSSELWRRARLNNVVLPLFRSVEMPSNPFELPIQGTDPTVYYVPETQNEADLTLDSSNNPMPDSQVGSGKVTLNAKKLAIRVGFSSELVEDSIIPVLPLYTEQAMRTMADGIDHVLLNGDTTATATGNINLDDSTPTSTAKYMAFNGLRYLPITTTAANKQDASGAPTLALMRTTRFLMAGKYSVNPMNLAWITDSATYGKLLGLAEVITLDKLGPQATVMTGQMGMIDGMPLLVSGEMGLTEADGKISATTGNNTKGQMLCVYRPGWVVGYRRRVSATMTYIPYYDAYQLVATVRIAFINFDADVASCLYDITV